MRATNDEVGRRIGLTHSAVSRIRSGQRLPGIQTMINIRNAFDWPLDEQVRLRDRPDAYAAELERRIKNAVPLQPIAPTPSAETGNGESG